MKGPVGEKNAVEILAISGIDAQHDDYHWLKTVLTRIFVDESQRSEQIARTGHRLLQLVQSPVDSAARREIRRIASAMVRAEPSGSHLLHATRAFIPLARARMAERRRTKNFVLKSRCPPRKELQRAIDSAGSLKDAAAELGVSARTLRRWRKELDMQ